MRLFIITCSLLLSACTMVTPAYQPLIQNTQVLKRASINNVSVGEITDAADSIDKGALLISARASYYGTCYGT